jgi:hypothetical protein
VPSVAGRSRKTKSRGGRVARVSGDA